MESNTEKKPLTNLQNESKKIKSDNFCYRKVGRAKKMGSKREKYNIAIAIFLSYKFLPLYLFKCDVSMFFNLYIYLITIYISI